MGYIFVSERIISILYLKSRCYLVALNIDLSEFKNQAFAFTKVFHNNSDSNSD